MMRERCRRMEYFRRAQIAQHHPLQHVGHWMSIVCPSPSQITLMTHSSLFSLSALNCSFCQSFNDPNGNKDNNALDPVYWWFSFEVWLTKLMEGACHQCCSSSQRPQPGHST